MGYIEIFSYIVGISNVALYLIVAQCIGAKWKRCKHSSKNVIVMWLDCVKCDLHYKQEQILYFFKSYLYIFFIICINITIYIYIYTSCIGTWPREKWTICNSLFCIIFVPMVSFMIPNICVWYPWYTIFIPGSRLWFYV